MSVSVKGMYLVFREVVGQKDKVFVRAEDLLSVVMRFMRRQEDHV